jgi:hypothetical protein
MTPEHHAFLLLLGPTGPLRVHTPKPSLLILTREYRLHRPLTQRLDISAIETKMLCRKIPFLRERTTKHAHIIRLSLVSTISKT